MAAKSEIPLPLAKLIIEQYQSVPPNRTDQIKLIKLRGYHQLRRRELAQCHDAQLYRVAKRILNDCYQRSQGRTQLQATLATKCQSDYTQMLYRTFNIPPKDSDPNYVSPEDLERLLLD